MKHAEDARMHAHKGHGDVRQEDEVEHEQQTDHVEVGEGRL